MERTPDVDLAARRHVGHRNPLAQGPAFGRLVAVVRDELPPRLPVRLGTEVGVRTRERRSADGFVHDRSLAPSGS